MLPLGERPLLVRVGVHYKFSKLLVDRVEAVDGTYDVLFIGTGRVYGEDVLFEVFDSVDLCAWHFSPYMDVFFTMTIYLYMFLTSADSGLVLKAIHLHREHGQSQEVTLEQLQVFQV